MPMTTVHRQIFDLLLPTCLTITQQMREKYEPKIVETEQKKDEPPKEIPEFAFDIIKEYSNLFNAIYVAAIMSFNGYKKDQIEKFIKNTKIQTDSGTLEDFLSGKTEESKIFYEPLTVIVLQAKTPNNNHLYPLNVPLIVYNGKTRRLLHPNGKVDNTSYNNLYDNIRIATDEEVEKCLESLSMMQQRTILNNELFAPYIARMFQGEEEEILVVDKGNNNPTKIVLLNTQEYTFDFKGNRSQGMDVVNRLMQEGWELSEDEQKLRHGKYLKLIPKHKQCIMTNFAKSPLSYENIMYEGVITEDEVQDFSNNDDDSED